MSVCVYVVWCMCVYVYVCMCKCVYVYMCVYACVSHVNVCVYVCMWSAWCMYVYACVCVWVCGVYVWSAGCISGISQVLIASPSELIKIQMQVCVCLNVCASMLWLKTCAERLSFQLLHVYLRFPSNLNVLTSLHFCHVVFYVNDAHSVCTTIICCVVFVCRYLVG